jgi:DHA1 family tetracycline resistance protein-like MFS transporter
MQGLISGKVPPNAQGELLGALTSTISIAAIIGPPLMTSLYSTFSGNSAPFHFPGSAFITGMIFALTSLFIAWQNLRNRV